MKILYVASLMPESILNKVLETNKTNYVVAPQKFHRTIVKGLVDNGASVTVLSYVPDNINVDYVKEYKENGILYKFIKCQGIPGIKHIEFVTSIIKYVRRQYKNGDVFDAIICDVLNVAMSIGALMAGRRFKVNVSAIVTDLLGISSHEEHGFINRMAAKLANSIKTKFDRYVLLTEQMCKVVNTRQRPYIIMEGICEDNITPPVYNHTPKIRKLFYAGGRPSKDGLDVLVLAFSRIKDENVQLHIYGNTDGVEALKCNSDPRIICHGIVSNDEIIKEEKEAYLLINPRPTHEEYTKYSFPSKVMEYMVSGIPVVTTKLSGIPPRYFDYLYTFNESSVECYYSTLVELLNKPTEQLVQKGKIARQFVIEQKNNKIQTQRIIELIS